jgi:hypothetical protein
VVIYVPLFVLCNSPQRKLTYQCGLKVACEISLVFRQKYMTYLPQKLHGGALAWRRGLHTYVVVLSPPATQENGAMGCEIESRLGIGW